MKILIFTLLFSVSLLSCEGHPELPTVNRVDLTRYQGKWYEIEKFPNWFQKKCGATQANYELKPNGKVKVINICKRKSDGSLKKATGVARTIDESNSKLKVSFVPIIGRLFEGDYYILALDSDYQFVLVGSPDREYLWILSRTRSMNKSDLSYLKNIARDLGFDISRLAKTPKWN